MSSNPSFIIPNFFYTVQYAAIELISKKPPTVDPTQIATNNKIRKIAIAHLTGAAIMAVGTVITLAALPYVITTTLGSVLLAALGITVYAAGHDIFVMANNAQTPESEVVRLLNNEGNPPNGILNIMSRDTFYQPVIVKFFEQHLTPAAAPAS